VFIIGSYGKDTVLFITKTKKVKIRHACDLCSWQIKEPSKSIYFFPQQTKVQRFVTNHYLVPIEGELLGRMTPTLLRLAEPYANF